MTLSDSIIRLKIGTSIAPPANNGDVRGKSYIGREIERRLTDYSVVWAARIWFGAATQTATIDFEAGTITPSTAGTRQVETTQIVAAGGCTAAGTLPVVVTGAGITGSPLTVNVPLTPQAHPTAALIAAAVAAKLAATTTISALWTIAPGNGDDLATDTIGATRIYPEGNDGTFNIAIPAGLGVTADTSSSNTTAGVTGLIIDRVGGDANDLHGVPLPEAAEAGSLLYAVPATAPNLITGDLTPILSPGGFLALDQPASALTSDVLTAAGKTCVDVIYLGK